MFLQDRLKWCRKSAKVKCRVTSSKWLKLATTPLEQLYLDQSMWAHTSADVPRPLFRYLQQFTGGTVGLCRP
jgi:hypothetical protein